MKKCPFCGEEVEEQLTKCPFCDKSLPEAAPMQKIEKKPKWYHNTVSLVIGFFVLGPFILPAVWSHPRYSQRTKMILTIVVLVLTLFLVRYTIEIFQQYMKIYNDILSGTY